MRMSKKLFGTIKNATDALTNLVQEYSAIGTPDECRAAMEKQIPKKQGNLYAEDSHLYIDRDGFVRCFKTKKDIRYPLMSLSDLDYCPRCGQKLDWSDSD